jgi:hypothetical protein
VQTNPPVDAADGPRIHLLRALTIGTAALTACAAKEGAGSPTDPPAAVATAYFEALEGARWEEAGGLLDPQFFRDSLQGAWGFDGRGPVPAEPDEAAAAYLQRMDPRSWWIDMLTGYAAQMPCFAERLVATLENPPLVRRTVLSKETVSGRDEWEGAVDARLLDPGDDATLVPFTAEAHYPTSPYHLSMTPPDLPMPVGTVRLRLTENGWRIRDQTVLQAGISVLNLEPDDPCVREAYARFFGEDAEGTEPDR